MGTIFLFTVVLGISVPNELVAFRRESEHHTCHPATWNDRLYRDDHSHGHDPVYPLFLENSHVYYDEVMEICRHVEESDDDHCILSAHALDQSQSAMRRMAEYEPTIRLVSNRFKAEYKQIPRSSRYHLYPRAYCASRDMHRRRHDDFHTQRKQIYLIISSRKRTTWRCLQSARRATWSWNITSD